MLIQDHRQGQPTPVLHIHIATQRNQCDVVRWALERVRLEGYHSPGHAIPRVAENGHTSSELLPLSPPLHLGALLGDKNHDVVKAMAANLTLT